MRKITILIGGIILIVSLGSAEVKKYSFIPSTEPQMLESEKFFKDGQIIKIIPIIRVDKFANDSGNNWKINVFWNPTRSSPASSFTPNKSYALKMSIDDKEFVLRVFTQYEFRLGFKSQFSKIIQLEKEPATCFMWVETYAAGKEPQEINPEKDPNSYGGWEK